MGWASSGFEIGNKLDARTYPAARAKRTGPPPSAQDPNFDPNAARSIPIRARPTAFQIREVSERANIALGPYVGPVLVKRLDYHIFGAPQNNPTPVLQLFYGGSPYVTANNVVVTAIPPGTPIWDSRIADDLPTTYPSHGGLTVTGIQAGPGGFLIDYYIPDAQVFLCMTVHALGAGPTFMTGSLMIYEGVLPSDFPAILG